MNVHRHYGVPIVVTRTERGFVADFTALTHFVGDPGGTVEASTEDLAIRSARDKIDEAVLKVAHTF